jgi:hypothetical protein
MKKERQKEKSRRGSQESDDDGAKGDETMRERRGT